ncbi:MAG: response regulator transcription factor [Saprospiraceae bacterium]|nr:response regulator transcription factor [Saprospiraceae bacterium]
MIRVLIADDHTMFADGIESLLETESGIDVVGKCYDGLSVFDMIEQHDIDVLLLDINLPEMNGIDVCKKLTSTHPGVRVLALSMHNDESIVSEILKNGAMGYILKNTGKAELVTAINKISQGQTYFSKDVTETIMRSLVNERKATRKNSMLTPIVSRREREVLSLIVKEYTTQEIAEQLHISQKTVESHRRSLLTKLNVRNTAGLVRVAVANDLVEA